MGITHLEDCAQIKQEPESLKSGNIEEDGHPYSAISSTNQQSLEEEVKPSASFISSLTSFINSKSEIGREISFDFKAVQHLLDACNMTRPDPEEASMEC